MRSLLLLLWSVVLSTAPLLPLLLDGVGVGWGAAIVVSMRKLGCRPHSGEVEHPLTIVNCRVLLYDGCPVCQSPRALFSCMKIRFAAYVPHKHTSSPTMPYAETRWCGLSFSTLYMFAEVENSSALTLLLVPIRDFCTELDSVGCCSPVA